VRIQSRESPIESSAASEGTGRWTIFLGAAAGVVGGWLWADDEPFDPSRLEREVLVMAADDPVALDIAPDGSV